VHGGSVAVVRFVVRRAVRVVARHAVRRVVAALRERLGEMQYASPVCELLRGPRAAGACGRAVRPSPAGRSCVAPRLECQRAPPGADCSCHLHPLRRSPASGSRRSCARGARA
jgi:hypothetical protein